MGEAGEGQNITHQQKKMGLEALRKFRDRFSIPVSDAQIEDIPFLTPGGTGRGYLESARRALGGPLPQRRAKSARSMYRELAAFSAQLAEHRGSRDLHDDGLRAHSQYAAARQGDRQICGADRSRRIAHLRHGRNVPPVRHLFPGRPALQAAGCRPAHVLPRGPIWTDAARGHQRGWRHVVMDRGRDLV